jgi:hypothetical protein
MKNSLFLLVWILVSPFAAAQGLRQEDGARRRQLAAVANFDEATVSFLDTIRHAEVLRMPVGERPRRIVMSRDRAFAYVGESGPPLAIRKIDLSTLTEVWKLELPTSMHSFLDELEISPDGRWLFAFDTRMGNFMLVDSRTSSVVGGQSLCPECDGVTAPEGIGLKAVFTSDSSHVWAAAGQLHELLLISVPDGRILGRVPAEGAGGSHFGGEILLFDGNDHLPLVHSPLLTAVYAGTSGESWKMRHNPPVGSDLVFAPDLGLYAFSGFSIGGQDGDYLDLVDIQRGTLEQIRAPMLVRKLEYNPVTHEVWAKSELGISTFNLKHFTRGPDIEVPSHQAFAEMAFTPDGRYLYYPGAAEVVVFDAKTYAMVKRIPVGEGSRTVVMQGDDSPSF